MKASLGSLAQVQPQKLWSAAVTGCLLVPMLFLAVVRQNSTPLPVMNLQVSIVQSDGSSLLDGESPGGDGGLGKEYHSQLPVENTNAFSGDVEKASVQDTENASGSDVEILIQQVENSGQETSEREQPSSSPAVEKKSSPTAASEAGGGIPSTSGIDSGSQNPAVAESTDAGYGRVNCDFTHVRTDICELHGDVRVNGRSSSVVLANPAPEGLVGGNSSWVVKPYARKWETNTMAYITQFHVITAGSASVSEAQGGGVPACTVNHAAPAVVFSTGGLQGNFFHDMADVLIPLFLTTHHYGSEVQFLITQYRPSWIQKYQAMLRRLSRYNIINLDVDSGVHCFPEVTVGLRSHKELGIDPAMEPQGYTMLDFRAFLRSSYGLMREFPMGRDPNRKPRLLFLSRRGSRSLLNERRVFRAARNVGFKVIVAPPDAARNMTQFARTVNSCDVMAGVHGAGLTNMIFLPSNATLLQIVPWGDIKYACRFPYGDPAIGMGLKYLEYEVGKKESSLIRQYPKNHPVLTNPISIHKQGFPVVWSIFIDKQNVTVDVDRFRPILEEALSQFR